MFITKFIIHMYNEQYPNIKKNKKSKGMTLSDSLIFKKNFNFNKGYYFKGIKEKNHKTLPLRVKKLDVNVALR